MNRTCRILCPKCGKPIRVPEQVAAHPEEIECHMADSKTPRSAYIRVRVTPDQLAALEAVARRDGATVSEVVRRLVADEVRRATSPAPARPKPHPPIVRDGW